MVPESTSSSLPPGESNPKTIIVGISGPTSSGKTTIARLLRRIFSVPWSDVGSPNEDDVEIRTFLVHEDDFYFTDDKIPLAKTPAGELVQDWDTIDAIDVPRFSSALSYVQKNGALPPFLKSKEDLNEERDSGISDEMVDRLRTQVQERLKPLLRGGDGRTPNSTISVAFVEGFLLYAPPPSMLQSHPLRPIHSKIDIPLFLPATYSLVKSRREGRSGYITLGPPPKPNPKSEDEGERGHGSGDSTGQSDKKEEDNYDEELPEQNFWQDPPGYVDDIVWPHYIKDHAWLLKPVPEGDAKDDDERQAKEGGYLREDVGVNVAPGKGEASMADVLEWSIDEVIQGVTKEMET